MLDFWSIYKNRINDRFLLEKSLVNSDSHEQLIHFELLVGMSILRNRHEPEIFEKSEIKKAENCQNCDEKFETIENKVFHIMENHVKMCPYCYTTYYDQYTVRQHIVLKHKTVYTEYLTIRQKIKEKIKPEDDPIRKHYQYACKICKKKFSKQNGVRQHELGHKTEKFFCEICAQNFKWRRSLQRHMRHQHLESKKYDCRFCNYQNTQRYKIRSHEEKHHPNVKKEE